MSGSIGDICEVRVNSTGSDGENKTFNLFKRGEGNQAVVCRASVIFGRNGSGKTTLAARIKEARDQSDAACTFLDKDGNAISLSPAESDRVRVFSEEYVRDKVLVEGEGLEAIVMLGAQATAKKRIDEIDAEIDGLNKDDAKYNKVVMDIETGPDSLTKFESKAKTDAKDGGWATRREKVEEGRQTLTQSRWDAIKQSKTAVSRRELEDRFNELLDKYAKVKSLGESADLMRMTHVDVAAYSEESLVEILNRELDEPVLSDREKRILALVQNGEQAIVEKARYVFANKKTAHCPMCQQPISQEYREDIERSVLKVLSKEADAFKLALENAKVDSIVMEPASRDAISRQTIETFDKALAYANERIGAFNGLVDERARSLYTPLGIDSLGIADAAEALNEAIDGINAEIDSLNQAARDKKRLKDELNTINDQIAWVDSRGKREKCNEVEKRLSEANSKLTEVRGKLANLKAERSRKEAEMNNASIAADVINDYLATVYFDTDRFRLVAEGDCYKVLSRGKPVPPKDISTGERNVLGLCYFFSEGGKERFKGTEDDDAQLIVLDDPVSSFDMENRVGVCSLIRERAWHILSTNSDSKILAMTHDRGAATEIATTFCDITEELADGPVKAPVCRLELRKDGTAKVNRKEIPEYASLLAKAYRYATSDEDDAAESYIIGNVLRRVLEGYATFNYGLGMRKITRDTDLKRRLGECEPMLSNLMYRLALNDGSHMEERVQALNPRNDFERYSNDEKKAMAQCAILTLWLLDEDHVEKQLRLADNNLDLKELANNVGRWKEKYS